MATLTIATTATEDPTRSEPTFDDQDPPESAARDPVLDEPVFNDQTPSEPAAESEKKEDHASDKSADGKSVQDDLMITD
jgi:hypothetical protein